ncbi:cadherin-like domain-containing protein [Candidatus Entotheonella palauensis]|uniref:cadherin-like domain-containing protein n=1 Tax=Candidatus Entotheonella palauensis TaxID=93172 RepID=UPI0015C4E65C|nr:cadherin-like domain-containing protein [Candidatus Entotheonella palauensis]
MTDAAFRCLIRILGLVSLALPLLVSCGGNEAQDGAATAHASQIVLHIKPPEATSLLRSPDVAALPTSRQMIVIARLQIDVHIPGRAKPVTARVDNLQDEFVVVELSVPQGTGRQIEVQAFNRAQAVIYAGTTQVDLIRAVQDVTIDLEPVLSLNPLIQAHVNAETGAQLTVDANARVLSGLTVTIPPGALTRDTVFTLGTRNHAGLLPALPPEVISVSPVLGFDAMGESLAEPASIAFPYRIANAGARQLELSEEELGNSTFHFFVLTPGSTSWQSLGNAAIDPAAGTITAPFIAFGSGVVGRMVNTPPMATAPPLTVLEDTVGQSQIHVQDPDDNQAHTFAITLAPTNGMANVSATGLVTYTPNTNASGPDTLTVTVTDSGEPPQSTMVVIPITITPANDPPQALTANLTTIEDAPFNGHLNAVDDDGDPLSFHIDQPAGKGVVTLTDPAMGTFVYTPHPNATGPDHFTFYVSDGLVNSNSAAINLSITPVDDPPVAMDDSRTTDEDRMVNIAVLMNDSEVDGEALTITAVTQGNQGTVTHDGTTITYTPDPDIHGMDSFTYTVRDAPGGTDTANVNVTITPVNDPPIALDRTLLSIDTIPTPGTLLGVDVDGNPLTFSIVSPPGLGATANIIDMFQGTYLYDFNMPQPPPNSLTYKVSDGTLDSNIATVTVDPPLMPYELGYATRAGAVQHEEGIALAPFDNGSVVVTGFFDGTMVLGQGSANETHLMSAGKRDMFIAKYLADGTLAWARQAGGAEDDEATGVMVMVWPNDNTMITGHFQLNATFGAGEPNETILTSAGQRDMFIAQYDPNGMLLWATQAGGSGDDRSLDMTPIFNPSGAAVITGSFQNTAVFGAGQPGEVMLTSAGQRDMFIAKYNLMGQLDWAKRAGGNGDDEGLAAATLSDDEAVITGTFRTTSTFGAAEPGETMLTSQGLGDVFVATYDHMNGMLIWVVQAGGSGEDAGTGVTTLLSEEVVVTGTFDNTATFTDAESTNIDLTSAGARDIFLVQYDSDALISWAVRAGGSGHDEASSIISLPDGSLATSGAFENTATFGPMEPGETMLTSNGLRDIFIAYYDFSGALIAARGIGGTGHDEARDITGLLNGQPVITGTFENMVTFGPGEPLETTLTAEGAKDLFLARFYWAPIPR